MATDLFFRARSLNNMIVIKEPNLDDVAGVHGRSLPVRTKLFLPYNTDVPYEGGESVFTDDVRFVPTLRHLSGGDGVSEQNFELDLLKIKLFEQLPSLDPFLVKERHFWTLGSNINGVQHAVAVWSKAVERVIDRTLPPAQMVRLMRTLRQIV